MLEHILIALALAMDCFAVSVVCGVIIRRREVGIMLHLAFLFGFFQALMPLIGWALTSRFSTYLTVVDHWIAFTLLAFIGGKMILDSFKADEEPHLNPSSLKTQLALSVATSIDALAVGISMACLGYERLSQLTLPLVMIGAVSVLFSVMGYLLGVRFGPIITRRLKPELAGGLVLLFIGIKVLVSHLFG